MVNNSVVLDSILFSVNFNIECQELCLQVSYNSPTAILHLKILLYLHMRVTFKYIGVIKIICYTNMRE